MREDIEMKINKRHMEFVRDILNCNDCDILEHKMKKLSFIDSFIIWGDWEVKSVEFVFENGKAFRVRWNPMRNDCKPLKNAFIEMLSYNRKERRKFYGSNQPNVRGWIIELLIASFSFLVSTYFTSWILFGV